jgi:hypothetical protein
MVHDDGPRKPDASRGVYERPTPGCLRKSARLSQPCLPESSSGFPERSAPLLLTPGCGTQSGPLHLSHQLRIAVDRRPSKPRDQLGHSTLFQRGYNRERMRVASRYWLPSPIAEFNLTMRLYAPKSDALTAKWNPPPITRVQGLPSLG